MYSDSFIELLKSKITLSSVIGKSVTIKNKGRYKVACCPFHKEKTPSFNIYDDNGSYHCYGCSEHGDVISFVMKRYGLNFKEAVDKLANENGIELPKLKKLDPKVQKKENELNILYEINEKACKYFQSLIFSNEGKDGLEYITKRGLKKDDINKFRIGFAANSYSGLLNHLKKLGFSEDDIMRAGLITISNKRSFDKFRNRVIFPVLNAAGKVIAFSGRVINNDKTSKYINSPDTPLYHKSNVLFNYFFARKAIYDNKNAILVEGNIDAIRLSINGIENVVAPMGTAITEYQIKELWKITDEIIICLDGDLAGKKATKRVADLALPMLTSSRSFRFVNLPDNQDPDDFIKRYGSAEFRKLINNKSKSINLSEFLWNYELLELNIDLKRSITPEEKSKLESNLNLLVEKIKDPIVRKNFKFFYNGKLFLLDRNNNKDNKLISQYKITTKIDYNKKKNSINTLDTLREIIINIEKNMVNIIKKDKSIIGDFYKKYEIILIDIDFFDKNITKILSIFYDQLNEDSKNGEFIFNELEKNDFKSYISDDGLLNVDSIDSGLDYLYSLFLERSFFVLEFELKKIAEDNFSKRRINAIYNELESLREKITNLENNIL